MNRKVRTRVVTGALSAAMIVSLLPVNVLAKVPTKIAVDADGWVIQRQSSDTTTELQEGWIVPDEDGNGVTIDYGKIVKDTGNEGWVVFDSDEEKYKNSSLEYDITFLEPTQGDWIAVAPTTRVTDGKNYEGFAITEGKGLERTGRLDGSESYGSIDNLLNFKFEYNKKYHLRMDTVNNNITVYLTIDGKEEKLTSFASPIGLEESTYGFRIWRGGKKIILDNIVRKEIITSDLAKNTEQIEADDWGKTDVSVPVEYGKGDSISSICNGDSVLAEGTDYIVENENLILKKEYIAAQETNFHLKVNFAKGSTAALTVMKYVPGVAQEYTWTPEQGIDMWESITGNNNFELTEDGLHIKGTNALINTLAPYTANGEIEVTFESFYDYEGYDMGAMFRANGSSWQGVAATGSEGGEGYWDFLKNGSKSRIIWDGTQNMSLAGVKDIKVKIRFVGDAVTIWIDDEFAQTTSRSEAEAVMGNMGVYVDNKGDIAVKKVVFRELNPFSEVKGERVTETIENDGLSVRVDNDFPRVADYTLNGKTLNGSEVRYNYVTINTVDYPATATMEKAEDGKSVTYHVKPEGIDVTFDVVFNVKEDHIVEMLIKNIVEPEGVLVNTINLPDQPLISANSAQEGAVLDASWVEENARQFRDVHENISDKKVSTTANRSASIPIITAGGLSAAMFNNVMFGGEEFVFRGFELENGEKSVGVWNQDFMYRGLDGEKLFPFPSEPDEEDLYCRIAITEDTNDDDKMDWQDGANALKKLTNGIIPGSDQAARSFFHVGYNFASGAQQPFLKVADNMKRLSNYMDGFSQQLVFKGYQNEGHDSCWGDYEDINKRAGGAADMNIAIAEADKLHSNIGIHLNNTGVTPEAKRYDDNHITSDSPGWVWMDQSRIIRRHADMLEGGFDDRMDQLFAQTPDLDFVYVDCWGDDRWAEKKLVGNMMKNGAEIFGTENGPDFIRFGAWVHHPDCASAISQFVYNNQRDVYHGSPVYWGGYSRGASMMSWQHNNNINTLVEQFFTNQLPQKYLMCHEILKNENGMGIFSDNVTSGNWVITKDGNKITDGQGKIFVPWYAEDSETKNPDEAAKIYHWNKNGGETTWTLPLSWNNLENVYLYQTTQNGKKLVDTIKVTDGQVTIDAQAKTPYVVYPGEAKADETEWSVGSPLKDTGFNTRDFSIWEKAGKADIQYNDDGNGVSVLTVNGTEEGSVSQTMEGLVPGQKYRLSLFAGAEKGKTARVVVELPNGEKYENYVEQVTMNCQYFDSYAKNKPVQRMWVDFTMPEGETTAKVTLSGDACEAEDGKATFLETRIVKTAEPDLEEGYVANETFEYVEQGAYGIFHPERSADGAPHLSETHLPYTNDTITGDWSLKLWGERGQGDVTVRTSPATARLRPNTQYQLEFDTTSYGRVYVQAEANGSDQVLNDSFEGGHSKYTFVTGDRDDYIVRIERGKVLDNFTIKEITIDEEALVELIESAKTSFVESDYTSKQWNAYQKEIAKAQVALDKDGSTQEDIQEAFKQLKKAMSDLSNSGGIAAGRDLPLDGMAATAGSVEADHGSEGPVKYIFDNNAGTFWHSDWSGTTLKNLWLDIALPEAMTVGGVRILSRADGGNGTIQKAEIWVKTADSEEYVKVVDQAVFEKEWTAVTFDEIENVTNVKIQPLQTVGGNKYASAAEVRIMGGIKEPETPVVDKTDLQKAVDVVNVLVKADYTTDSWAVVEEKLSVAQAVLENAEATDYEVLLATANLETAIRGLVAVAEKADKTDLAELIKYAESQKENEDYDYVVPVVKNAFEAALDAAVTVNNNAAATQAEVDAAYDKLLKMTHYLGFTGNSESLKVLADAAKKLNEKLYTADSWNVLADALEKAEEVLADENTLQAEINAAKEALQSAMDALEKITVNKEKLQKLVDKSNKYEDAIADYTPETAEIFEGALANARDILSKEDMTQEEIDAAYTALQNAIFGLRTIPNKDKLEDLIGKAEKVDTANYTVKSALAFAAALDNAKAVFADENVTEEQVKAAEKELKEAQKNLVVKADADKEDGDKVDNNTAGKDDDKVGNKVASDDGSKKEASKSVAKTGDATSALPAAVLGSAALAVLMALKKRR